MGTKIGVIGDIETTIDDLQQFLIEQLQTEVIVLDHGPQVVRKVAIVSGFGADKIGQAYALGADTLLTGETSHANYWAAADYGMNVIFAGHYATETVGVKALGIHLNETFGIAVKFFDFPTDM